MRVFSVSAFVLALAAGFSAWAQESAPVDLKAGEAKYQATCASCHGVNGASIVPTQPILAGQHAEYLEIQTRLYRDGERQNAVMGAMAKGLTDAEIRDISAFLAAQAPVIAGAEDMALARSAETLYRGGDIVRGVPACAACHGPAGAGIPPQYPRVSGQHAEYVASTLREYATEARANDIMTSISARLTEDEITALAEYISGLSH